MEPYVAVDGINGIDRELDAGTGEGGRMPDIHLDECTSFVENLGQLDKGDVLFYTDAGSFRALFLENAVRYCILGEERAFVYQVDILGSHPVSIEGMDTKVQESNHFRGSDPDEWVTNIRHFGSLRYEDIYPGIDMVFHIRDGGLKYDLILGPGADPELIRFRYNDVGTRISDDGGLIIETPLGIVEEGAPFSYQGAEVVECSWENTGDGDEIGYHVGEYDRSRELVIDPKIVFSTYYGGREREGPFETRVDEDGIMTVMGVNIHGYFPTVPGSFDVEYNDQYDTFILRFDPYTMQPVFSTYIGGESHDYPEAMDMDDNGKVYVVGYSSGSDYPCTPDAFQKDLAGSSDIFFTVLSSTGDSLMYSTYIGGANATIIGSDSAWDVFVDEKGSSFIVGKTDTDDFPVTQGAYDTTHNGDFDIVVLKFSSSFGEPRFSTFIGGNSYDMACDVEVSHTGEVIISGTTDSSDFPGMSYSTREIDRQLFILTLNSEGSDISHSIFPADCEVSFIEDMEVKGNGDVVLFGKTGNPGFTTTSGAYDTSFNGDWDFFIMELDRNLTGIGFSTLLGGAEYELHIYGEISKEGTIHLAGMTYSKNFPIAGKYLNNSHEDDSHTGFYAELSENGRNLLYSSYLSAPLADSVSDMSLDDEHGIVYLPMVTKESGLNTTDGAYDNEYNGEGDLFLTALLIDDPLGPPINFTGNASDGFNHLEWEPPDQCRFFPVVNYSVFRGTNPAALEEIAVVDPGITNYDDFGLVNGRRYFYRIRGNAEIGAGKMSPEVSLVPFGIPLEPNITEYDSGDGWAYIHWTPPEFDGGSPITGYRIYRGGSIEEIEPIDELGSSGFSYMDETVANGNEYFYSVRAVNSRGPGVFALDVNILVGEPPFAPLNLTAEPTDIGEVTLQWSPPKSTYGWDLDHYKLYRGKDPSDMEHLINLTSVRFHIDEGLDIGDMYYYSVSAETRKGEGERTPVVNVRSVELPKAPEITSIEEGDGTVTLQWTNEETVRTGLLLLYEISKTRPTGSTGPLITVTNTTFTDTGLINGVEYAYSVRAVNVLGPGNFSEDVTAVPFTEPGIPSELELGPEDRGINISWEGPEDNGGREITGYSIYYRPKRAQSWQRIEVGTVFEHSIEDLQKGEVYQVKVAARNLELEGNATPLKEMLVLTYPDKPLRLSFQQTSDSMIRFNWNPPVDTGGGNITGYSVMRDGRELSITPGWRTYLNDSGLELDTDYTYTVSAINDLGKGELSDELEVLLYRLPGVPKDIEVARVAEGVRITWAPPENPEEVIGYRIYRSVDLGAEEMIKETGPEELEFIDTDVEVGSSYDYYVSAFSEHGEGEMSQDHGITVEEYTEENGKDGKSGGVFLFISLGVVVLIALVVGLAIFLFFRKKDKIPDEKEDRGPEEKDVEVETSQGPPTEPFERAEWLNRIAAENGVDLKSMEQQYRSALNMNKHGFGETAVKAISGYNQQLEGYLLQYGLLPQETPYVQQTDVEPPTQDQATYQQQYQKDQYSPPQQQQTAPQQMQEPSPQQQAGPQNNYRQESVQGQKQNEPIQQEYRQGPPSQQYQ